MQDHGQTEPHHLPGEGPNTAWFERLNAFEQQETLRQVAFKRSRWPDMPDGAWSKNRRLTYPHILTEGCLERVFFNDIATDVLRYCRDDSDPIAIHTEALNLRSSQVCCFNVLFPLREDLDLARVALVSVLPGVEAVGRIEFEYTGPDGATEWLGEPSGGGRGLNRTSVDAAVWWRGPKGRHLTLIEWKYTERKFGTCGGFESPGNRRQDICLGLAAPRPEAAQQCYLTQGPHHRRYWQHLQEAGIDTQALARVEGCPFRGPFYQLLRLFLLAAFCRTEEGLDAVEVIVLSFRGNDSLSRVPRHLHGLGATIVEAWNAVLVNVPPLRHAWVEQIADALRGQRAAGRGSLVDYLGERYGL